MPDGWNLPEPPTADADIVSGVACDPSKALRRARRRSEYGSRGNTMANRKNGGTAATYRPRAHDLAGAMIMLPPTTAGVRTSDNWGIPFKREHMLTVTDEDTKFRNREREIAARRNLSEYR